MVRFTLLLITSLGILLPHLSPGQTLNGKVILGPYESDAPLGNVRIGATGFTNQVSDSEMGTFSLSLPGKQPGDQISLTIVKDGYAVINQKALKPFLPRDPSKELVIHMAPRAERDRMAIAYYQIRIEQKIDADFKAEMKQLIAEGAGELDADRISQLANERDAALAQVERMAEALAKVDLDNASELYQRAFALFPEQIDSVLAVLQEDLLDAELAKANELEAKAKASREQTIEGYLLRAQVLIIKRSYEEARRCYQKALSADSTNVNTLWDYADFLNVQNQNQQAIELLKQALRHNSDSSRAASLLNNLGINCIKLGQNRNAISHFKKALKITPILSVRDTIRLLTEESHNPPPLRVAYRSLGEFEESVKALKMALEIRREFAKANPATFEPLLAKTLSNLARTFVGQNQYEKAKNLFEEASTILRNSYYKDSLKYSLDFSQALSNLANCYLDLKLFSNALDAHREALVIQRRLFRDNPKRMKPIMGQSLYNYGITLKSTSRYEEAVEIFKEAKIILADVPSFDLAPLQSQLAITLNEVGFKLAKDDKHEDAISLYQEALFIQKSLEPVNSLTYQSQIAITLDRLGTSFIYAGTFSEAIPVIKEAIALKSQLVRLDSIYYGPLLGDSYYLLADAFRRGYQFNEALKYFMLADSAYELGPLPENKKVFKENARSWISKLSEVDFYPKKKMEQGITFHHNNDTDSAKVYLQAAVIGFEVIPFDSLDVYEWYNASFAFIYLSFYEQDFQKRLIYQQKAVQFQEQLLKVLPSNTDLQANVASSHSYLSWYALFSKSFKEAEASAHRSLSLAPERLSIISNLAASLLYQGRFEEAKTYYAEYANKSWPSERFETFRQAFLSDLKELEAAGITHPDVAKIREILTK